MKKGYTIICFIVLMSVLTGCATGAKKESNDKLTVYTSFYTMYDFTSKIVGDKANVVNLVTDGTEPHEWEPSTTDMAALEKADMLIYNGAGMEHWIEQVAASLDNKLILVEASKGIDLISGEGEEHSDPHVWLDAKNAKFEMEAIKNALVQADAKNATYYEENYNKYATMFDELDSQLSTRLSALPDKNIIVSHEAFSYLCNAYGLKQTSIGDLEADAEPDANKIAKIVEFAKENNVSTIFFEELVSPKVAQVIANEIGAKTAVLNPIEGLTKEQSQAGVDYFSLMKENIEVLETALNHE